MHMQGQLPGNPQLAMQLAGLPSNDPLPPGVLQGTGGPNAFMGDIGPMGMGGPMQGQQGGGGMMHHHDLMLGHQHY